MTHPESQAEREAFEKWKMALPSDHDAVTGYGSGDTPYWIAWQARAALPPV